MLSDRTLRLRPLIRSCFATRLLAICTMLAAGTGWGAEVDAEFQSAPLLLTQVPGRVRVLSDDSFLVFSGFNRWNAADHGPLVKFGPDGTRVVGFRMPSGAYDVSAVTELPGGKLLVGSYEVGKAKNVYRLQRLNSDGSADTAFNPRIADGRIFAIEVLPDGKLLVGGVFQKFDGEARQGLVRLHANGGLDTSFAALRFSNDGVRSNIAVQPDGKILVGGVFTSINEASRDGVARLNTDGTLDGSFTTPQFGRWNNGNLGTRAIAIEPDGRILVTGRFRDTSVVPNLYSPLLRLNTNGTTERIFAGRTSGVLQPFMSTLELLPNGHVSGAGDRLYSYLPDGSIATTATVYTLTGPSPTMARQTTGKFLVSGVRSMNGMPGMRIERFSAALTHEPLENGSYSNESAPSTMATRSDGKTYVSGFMDRVGDAAFNGVARLRADGSFDPSFNTTAHGISSPNGVALQPDDSTVVFRGSYTWNGETTGEYKRLLRDDAPDGLFQPDAALTFGELAPAGAGKYFVLKPHSAYGILDNNAFRKLGSTGTVDAGFQCGIDFRQEAQFGAFLWVGDNRHIAQDRDGRVLLRYFARPGNYHLKRLNPDGSVDASFTAGTVRALGQTTAQETIFYGNFHSFYEVTRASGHALSDAEMLPDGKVVVVGMFAEYNGVPAAGIVRLKPDGTVDSTFAAGAGAHWTATTPDAEHIPKIDSIERLIGGKFLITGDFEAYDGNAAPGIARLNANGSFDGSFVPPVALQAPNALYPQVYTSTLSSSNVSVLKTQPDRSVLLSGNYAPAGSSAVRALTRLKQVGETALLNVSTRLRVETGDNVLIGGFIITGDEPKQVIIRAVGPSLANFGITEALANPKLELRNSSQALLAENDDWRQMQEAAIRATGLAPQHDLESAIVATLNPGAYTSIVRGIGPSGVGLVEVYDLMPTSAGRLANISTRGYVTSGQNVMIGGFISGPETMRVAVRAVGPSLVPFGITNPLPDPVLELRNANGQITASNNNWQDDAAQAQELRDRRLAPGDPLDAALTTTIVGGGHTAIVRDANGAPGVGIVEVFRLDQAITDSAISALRSFRRTR